MNKTLYSSDEVQKLLRDLTPSHETIVTTSDAFLTLGESGFFRTLTDDWEAAYGRYLAPDQQSKRQALLYLANDIIQKCSKKVPDFRETFKQSLLKVFHVIKERKDTTLTEIALKLIDLWKTRKIYPKTDINKMKEALIEQNVEQAEETKTVELPEGLINVPQELVMFVDSSRDTEKWSDKARESQGKMKKILRSRNFDADEAELNLQEYKRCVGLEQKYRTNLIKAYMELMRSLDIDHVKYIEMMKKMTKLSENIEEILGSEKGGK